jgi:hypothetical protein
MFLPVDRFARYHCHIDIDFDLPPNCYVKYLSKYIRREPQPTYVLCWRQLHALLTYLLPRLLDESCTSNLSSIAKFICWRVGCMRVVEYQSRGLRHIHGLFDVSSGIVMPDTFAESLLENARDDPEFAEVD